MKIGFRAHDFGTFNTPQELADTISQYSKDSLIQLALGKSIPSCRKWQEWDEQYIGSISEILHKNNIGIAVIGCYINPVHPDKEELNQHIGRFRKSLSLSSAFGCRIVATETGSASPDCSYNPATMEDSVFSTLLSTIEQLLVTAEKEDAVVALEPVSRVHTICSIERTVKVLETFKSPNLKIIYDPINLAPWLGIQEEDGSVRLKPGENAVRSFISEALDAFGKDIVAIHAKNYILDANGWKKGDMPLLEGVFNWEYAFSEFRKHDIDVPVLLENLRPATLEKTMEYLNGI